MHRLSTKAAAELQEFVESQREWPCQLADGEVRIICAPLPGRAVIGVERAGDTLWIVVDATKPGARDQLAALIDDWPLGPDDEPLGQWTMDDVIGLLAPFSTDGVDGGSSTAIR